MQASRPVQVLHTENPLRIWSLIVTIFGDAVMDKGRNATPSPVWIASLQVLFDELSIDAGLVRTNLSRLVANGTLLRDKSGRNTFYRLSHESAANFAEASTIIYDRMPRHATGLFHLVSIDRAASRQEARASLEAQGFRFLGPTTALLPEHFERAKPALPEGVLPAMAEPSDALRQALPELWPIDALDEGYRCFIKSFSRCTEDELASPAAAIVWRIVAVHLYRRLVLRDPVLPAAMLPADWPGPAARDTFDRLMALAQDPSDRWLRENGFRG